MNWQPARVKDNSLRAVAYAGKLHITATVVAPTPRYVARVAMSPILIFPPQFVVQQLDLGGATTQVLTDIPACGEFGLLPRVDSVVVQTADGPRNVQIERTDGGAKQLGGGELPSPPAGGDVAIGWSDHLNYEEALRNACHELSRGPDDRVFAEVIGTGAVIGGIDGQQRLWVRAKRIWFDEKGGSKLTT